MLETFCLQAVDAGLHTDENPPFVDEFRVVAGLRDRKADSYHNISAELVKAGGNS